MVNNGIINIGNNNQNTINQELNFDELIKEIQILMEYNNDPALEEALKYCKTKDKPKLISCLKTISKEAINMIRHLSLITLQKLIDKILFKN